MPQLTDFQKTILQTRIHDGGIIRNIAAELGVSSSTVLRAKNKIAQTGTIIRRQGSRRKRASTAEQDSDLVNFLRRHPFKVSKGKSSGRPPVSHKIVEDLRETVEETPQITVARLSQLSGVPRSTCHKIIKNRLQLHSS
jgi:transposase